MRKREGKNGLPSEHGICGKTPLIGKKAKKRGKVAKKRGKKREGQTKERDLIVKKN